MSSTLAQYNFFKAFSWYTLGSLLIKAISFVTLPLFTKLLSTADFGVYGLYLSYLGLCEMTVLVGAVHSMRVIKYDESYDFDRYVSSIIVLPVIGAALLTLILQVYFVFFSELGALNKSVWMAICFTSGISAIANILSSKLVLEGEYKKYVLYSLTNTSLNVVLSIVFCYTIFNNGDAYWARIYGAVVGFSIGGVLLLFLCNLKRPLRKYVKQGVIIGCPLLLHAIGTQILVQTDKIIIAEMETFSAVGIYSVATTLAAIPMVVLSSLENSWAPWFLTKLAEKNYAEIRQKNNFCIRMFAIGIFIFVLMSPDFVYWFTVETYWDAMFALMPLSIAVFAEFIYIIPLNVEMFYVKTSQIWIYTVAVIIVNIVFDIIMLNYYGYLAAAYVTCAVRVLLFGMHYRYVLTLDDNEVFDKNIIFCSIGLLILGNFIGGYFRDSSIIRWGIISVIGISITLYYRDRVSKFWIKRGLC